jgi:triacylglycerol lipase
MAFPFNPDFEINVALPLAEAAYDAANDIPLKLPDGYTKLAEITADTGKVAAHIAMAKPSQQMLFRAMLLDVKRPHTFGIVAKNGDTVAVVFRGTQRAEEWLKDFDAEHVPYQPVAGFGTVHDGFQKIYDTTAASVRAGLAACGTRTRTVLIGHSLGAALAVLCAPDVAKNAAQGDPPEVHSFAGPRTAGPDRGASLFAEQFDKAIPACYRMVNHWDIVPHLPPAVMQFQHVGTAVGLDGGFTLDLARAHSLLLSYLPGLRHLVPQTARSLFLARVA